MPLSKPLTAPSLLRRVAVSSLPDGDWGATQAVPPASACGDVVGVARVGATFVAFEADGTTVSSGSIDVQLVDVATTVARPGVASRPLVKSAPVDAAVPQGRGLEWDVSRSTVVAIRLGNPASLAPAAAFVDVYWNALE